MLTDDDITARLRSSFDHATADLHYTRRVTPPRPRMAMVLAPAATLVGAAAVGALALGQPAAAPSPRVTPTGPPTQVATPSASTTPSPQGRLVKIRFAGYVMSYRVPAGEPLHSDAMAALVADPVPAPSDARTVTNLDGLQGLVGRYPGTSREALWVTLPTLEGGRLVALVSPDLTQGQLIDLWRQSSPSAS